MDNLGGKIDMEQRNYSYLEKNTSSLRATDNIHNEMSIFFNLTTHIRENIYRSNLILIESDFLLNE